MNNVKATEEFNNLQLADKKESFRKMMYNVVRRLEKHSVVFGTPKNSPSTYRLKINGPIVNVDTSRNNS